MEKCFQVCPMIEATITFVGNSSLSFEIKFIRKIGIGRNGGFCRRGRRQGRRDRLITGHGQRYNHQKSQQSNQDPTPILSHEFSHLLG